MRGTRDRNAAVNNGNQKAIVVTHSWLPYSLLSICYLLGALTWFGTMIATVGYSGTIVPAGTASGQVPTMTSAFFGFINLYLFRMLCLFVSLAVTYEAERHYLSRGWAWTSWVTNTLLLFSWLATDLPFVYSTFSYFSDGLQNGATINGVGSTAGASGAAGFPDDSARTHYCGVLSSYWCNINYTHGVLSVYCDAVIGLTWMFACYQLARARGVSNLLLTAAETLVILLTVLGLVGYVIWTCSTIELGITRNFNTFSYLEGTAGLNTYQMQWPNLIWGNYLLHAAIIASFAATAYISFGATTAPRMTALITNWLAFMCMLPMFIYLARYAEDFGLCNGDEGNGSIHCRSINGVLAGMGIVMAMNFLLGLTMFAVLAQAETADFAVDMYGDKARAIDDARSTGALPMKDVAGPYDTTRPSTPEAGYRAGPLVGNPQLGSNAPLAGNSGMIAGNGPAYAGAPMARGEDVELGAPVY